MSSTSATNSITSGTLGDAAPVSFPGIASGIDYDEIIEKYTAETLEQEQPTKTQINNLNAQNTAILKLTNLIGSVQDSLTALSNPALFNAFKATVSNATDGSTPATATQISGQTPIAGTYVINAQKAATATSVTNNPIANAQLSTTADLDAAGAAISPVNGTSGSGVFTIDGQTVNYNVTTETIGQIVASINTALQTANGTPGTGTYATFDDTTGVVSLTGVTTIGSGGDSGNLESVLKLDTAQLSGGAIQSSSSIAGLNQTTALSATDNAGLVTQVTNGTFTVNGVQFTVNTQTDSISSLINEINSSSAGVTATYNNATSSLTLTSTTPGPQSILLGAGSDTSNFLSAVGLTSSAALPDNAGTVTAGTQASLSYTNPQGVETTVYSSTDSFTNAIPGIDLTVSESSPSTLPVGSTYYTVNVAADPTQAEAAINSFITAYNAAIQQLNEDTVAPTVTPGTDSTTGVASATSSGGGVLYGNYQISGLRDQLVDLVSGFIPSGSTAYNSLQSVGILLDTNSQAVGTTSDSTDSTDSTTADSTSASDNNSFTVNATSGQLQALDTTTFAAAYAANPSAVANLFTLSPKLSGTQLGAQPVAGATYGFSYLMGSALANTDGLTTFLTGSVIAPDNLSSVLLTELADANNQQIDSLTAQINLINQEATNQADQLRQQFTASESQIAELQALQEQIAAIGH